MKTPGVVTPWFAGAPFPLAQNKPLQLGWALVPEACCAVAGINHAEFAQVDLKHSDLGETMFELGQRQAERPAALTVLAVHDLLEALESARGPTGKRPLLIQALQHCTPLEAKFVLKVLTGDLRLGLKEGLVEEAIARAFDADSEQVRRAHLLLGNMGQTAELARNGALASAALMPFRPVRCMLASAEATAAAVWARMQQRAGLELAPPENMDGPDARTQSAQQAAQGAAAPELLSAVPGPDSVQPVWVEDKFDGIRCQVHPVGKRVALYSRDLKEVTATFPELARAAQDLRADVILDGEILALRGDQVRPFAELQHRLGRQEADLFLGTEVPVKFIAFDLLWCKRSKPAGPAVGSAPGRLGGFGPAT